MALYAIGDIHGCYESFLALLESIAFDSARDRLWLVGDLVNRGPYSLDVLRWVYRNRHRCTVVLGNHDLHLISRHFRLARAKPSDTLDEVLAAKDCPELIRWLCRRPLIYREAAYVLVHAGILPKWTLEQAIHYADAACEQLSSAETRTRLLRQSRRTRRIDWATPCGWEEAVAAVRVMTRIRTCHSESRLCRGFSGSPEEAPEGCLPWYAFPAIRQHACTFIFGHWSRAGYRQSRNAICLDSGCLYGGALTALSLDDRSVTQVELCPDERLQPGT